MVEVYRAGEGWGRYRDSKGRDQFQANTDTITLELPVEVTSTKTKSSEVDGDFLFDFVECDGVENMDKKAFPIQKLSQTPLMNIRLKIGVYI